MATAAALVRFSAIQEAEINLLRRRADLEASIYDAEQLQHALDIERDRVRVESERVEALSRLAARRERQAHLEREQLDRMLSELSIYGII